MFTSAICLRAPLAVCLVLACSARLTGAEPAGWEHALATMPLPAGLKELNRTNCIPALLNAFQSNRIVKALVFLPGATDEFYHFHRARASLSSAAPTLGDAVAALTNQTLIRVTFRPPMLLFHTWEDPTEPVIRIESEKTAAKVRRKRFLEHAHFNDRRWTVLQPILERRLDVFVKPKASATDAWHFYRHSLAGWHLDGMEALEAISLAGMTTVTLTSRAVVFTGDTRPRWNRDLKVPLGTDPQRP